MAAADNYHGWLFSLFAPLIRGSVLEVGCGVGTFSARILRSGLASSFAAIDTSPAAIRHCRARIHAEDGVFNCLDLAAVPGSYDLVVCMNVLEHVEDDRQFVKRLLELLRPGGSCFLVVPAHARLYSAFDRAAGHFRRYSKSALFALVSVQAGAERLLVTQRYFNAIGAVGYFLTYAVLRKSGLDPAPRRIAFFDRWVVPLARRIEPRWTPFGLSLITTVERPAESAALSPAPRG
jgi:SAM-dependent methyltransferase